MNKLSITEQIKQILDNGNEDVIAMDQQNRSIVFMVIKDIVVGGLGASIDADTFIAQVGGTLAESSYVYTYNYMGSYAWRRNGVSYDMASLGITIKGVPISGDTVTVNCNISQNKVERIITQREKLIFENGDLGYDTPNRANYINCISDNSKVSFKIKNGSLSDVLIEGCSSKLEMFKEFDRLKVYVTSTEYFESAKVKLIVARVDI